MIPSVFVWLEKFPFMPSGKLDRSALPPPENSRPILAGAYASPCEQVESKLAVIWEDVLEIDAVGMHDDYFLLGGHSLLATSIMSRISHVFDVDLSMRELFENPSVAKLALVIAEQISPDGKP